MNPHSLLSQKKTADMLEISAGTLRDWRRRDLLDGLGEEAGGRWHYEFCEALAIAVALKVVDRAVFLEDAVFVGRIIACMFIARKFDRRFEGEVYKDFIIFTGDYSEGGKLSVQLADSLAEIAPHTFIKATAAIVYLPDLFDLLPEPFKAGVCDLEDI